MSGVVKGVRKTFKKVVNVAKKVAPFALADWVTPSLHDVAWLTLVAVLATGLLAGGHAQGRGLDRSG